MGVYPTNRAASALNFPKAVFLEFSVRNLFYVFFFAATSNRSLGCDNVLSRTARNGTKYFAVSRVG
jgi:hypothetical protein